MTNQIKSLQQAMNVARSRRNDAWDAYDKIRTQDHPNLGTLDSLHNAYEKEQAFYEGFMMAVFAAGYSVQTQVGTDECTITK